MGVKTTSFSSLLRDLLGSSRSPAGPVFPVDPGISRIPGHLQDLQLLQFCRFLQPLQLVQILRTLRIVQLSVCFYERPDQQLQRPYLSPKTCPFRANDPFFTCDPPRHLQALCNFLFPDRACQTEPRTIDFKSPLTPAARLYFAGSLSLIARVKVSAADFSSRDLLYPSPPRSRVTCKHPAKCCPPIAPVKLGPASFIPRTSLSTADRSYYTRSRMERGAPPISV